MNYITLVLDKSAFQGLAPREAEWLFHHFRVNMPPVFFAEVLADLTKRKPRTASAEGDVKALAKKIKSYAVHENVAADQLMHSELRGRRFPMDGRIIDARAEEIRLDNGERAIFADATPTQDMLHRWGEGDFSQNDRDFAREWREGISQIKLEETFRQSKALRRAEVRDTHDVDKLVNTLLQGRDFQLLNTLYDLAGLHPRVRVGAVEAWRKDGKPPIAQFFPYSHFVLRVELYFLLGLANQVVTTRDTNRIDIEYLKYLPFTHVFASADDLHIQAAQHFLFGHNYFIAGGELKKAMAEIADFWDAVDEKTKARGTASYADFPPPELNNAVTDIYDRHIPNWRVGANEPKPPISREENDRIMKELRPMMEAMERARKSKS